MVRRAHHERFISDKVLNTVHPELSRRSCLFSKPSVEYVASDLEKIERNVYFLSTGFHKIRAIVYAKSDIEEEQKQRMEININKKKAMKNKGIIG